MSFAELLATLVAAGHRPRLYTGDPLGPREFRERNPRGTYLYSWTLATKFCPPIGHILALVDGVAFNDLSTEIKLDESYAPKIAFNFALAL